MGTKANPAPNDCYTKAEPDEPMFVLLARDPLAPELVRLWADRRWRADGERTPKVEEAYTCANDMRDWRKANQQDD